MEIGEAVGCSLDFKNLKRAIEWEGGGGRRLLLGFFF